MELKTGRKPCFFYHANVKSRNLYLSLQQIGVTRQICVSTHANRRKRLYIKAMDITTEYLKTQFDEFNRAYFGSTLPEPKLCVNNSRTMLGQFRCKRQRRPLSRRTTYTDLTIKVSRYYDMPEREYQNVLLHEMIHMYIAVKGLKDTSPHGVVFREIKDRLNSMYGWTVTVSGRNRQWPVAEANRKRLYNVLTLETTDGRTFVSVVNPAYIDSVNSMATMSPMVKSHRWHTSSDEYFASFPLTRSLRGRLTNRRELERILPEEKE